MIDVPWFMLSPSPVSLIQYAVISFFIARHLLRVKAFNNEKKWMRWLNYSLNGFFVLAFFVLIGDAFWSGLCALKWIPLFPEDSFQIISSFGRDILGAGLMFVLMGDLFLEGKLWFSKSTFLWMVLAFEMQLFWFLYAPSPAWTDYTFAWRHGFSLDVVLGSWLLGHWIMRIPIWLAIWSTFKKKPEQIKEKGSVSCGS